MGGLLTAPAHDPETALSDRPPHTVILSGYYLQETEVTNGELAGFYQLLKKTAETVEPGVHRIMRASN